MKKTGKAKTFFIVLGAVMLGAVAGGTIARATRNNEKEPTKQEQTFSVEWEEGTFNGGNGNTERDWEKDVGMPICYRTGFIPYDEFNLSWAADSGAVYVDIYFYNENKEWLERTLRLIPRTDHTYQNFSWDNRESYVTEDVTGSIPPETIAKYVRVSVMGESVDSNLNTDKITITFKG